MSPKIISTQTARQSTTGNNIIFTIYHYQRNNFCAIKVQNQNVIQEQNQNVIDDIFWGSYEIMGVSLVDLYTWRWLYDNPQATAQQLRSEERRVG